MPEVNPPGTRRLDVTCDHVTVALRAMREVRGVLNATVFGQSMHLLVDERACARRDRGKAAKRWNYPVRIFTRWVRRSRMCSFRSPRSMRERINRGRRREDWIDG